VDELPDGRLLRQRGFVPCHVALLEDVNLHADLCEVISGRSVALLGSHGSSERIALALLRLRAAGVREFCAFAQFRQQKGCDVMKAAEGRATYGAPVLIDPRLARLNTEVEQLVMRGRHAAAERTLRAAVAAFDRRADDVCAGDVELKRGRLLLRRGRATDAKAAFAGAHERFQRARAASRALDATVYLGLAQTDLGLLNDAEHTCRAAHSAASALGGPDRRLFPAIALGRVLLWQKRYADARAILESVSAVGEAEQCARYWCLASRLRLAVDAVADARRAVEHARPPASNLSPPIEALVRDCEAAIQAAVGDVEALRVHVTNGLAAARGARLPLQAIKLRVTYVEGLIKAERFGQARAAARHLARLRGGGVPPLLNSRIERVLSGLNRTPSVRESSVRFLVTTSAADLQDLNGLRELLAASHCEDEAGALARAAVAIRRHTDAAGVCIFGWCASASSVLGESGTAGKAMARRAIEIGQPIRPEMSGGWIEAAVPIQYLGRIIGALGMRWSVDGPACADRALAFAAAAAAVCAPLVYVLMERQSRLHPQECEFDLIGTSAAIAEVRKAIARAANAPFTVLLEGESGSGKELVARAIHRAGCRRDRRFSALNCAAMPEDLVDAELFGHAKGAFTGAATERLGLFESADGGTVFLDEVGELSARAQAKVLRVLQEGEVRRIGENFTRPFDARLVAATNRSLGAEADAGRFRRDLLYRLDVIRINVPPLRDRVEDIPLLAARFWRQAADRIGSKAVLGHGALCALARYDWPGNVRELQNVLTALVVAVPPRGFARAEDLPAAIARAAQVPAHESLESARLKFEERFVRAALARSAGHRGQTAAALGLSRQGLAKLMQRLHLGS
ncbi:MAG TPA: sigma-54 dependent transcriptional regulator, partial [Vicinamibacterales bacterium]|nr:sigma-54 dependent transcriptional regulator [Vicinamibacterales bacterium]